MSLKRNSLFLLFATVAIPMFSAHADPIADKQAKTGAEESIKDSVDSMNSSCGSKFAVAIDWNSWGKLSADQLGSHSVGAICADLPNGVGGFCGSGATAKASVNDKVKKLVCAYGKPVVSLDNGTLTMTVDLVSPTASEMVTSYLKKTL